MRTLNKMNPPESYNVNEIARKEKERLTGLAGKDGNVWAAYGLAESAPAPPRLAFDLIDYMTSRYGGCGRAYHDLGFRFHWKLNRHGFYGIAAGRLYVNMKREALSYFGSLPLIHSMEELKKSPSSALYHRPETPRRKGLAYHLRLPVHIWRLSRSDVVLRKRRAEYARSFKRTLAEIDAEIAVMGKTYADKGFLSTGLQDDGKQNVKPEEIIKAASEEFELTAGPTAKAYFIAQVLATVSQMGFEKTMAAADPARGMVTARVLTSALPGDPVPQFTLDLCEMSENKISKKDFLEKWGHVGVSEFDPSSKRISEDHGLLELLISHLNKAGVETIKKTFEENRSAQANCNVELRKKMMAAGSPKKMNPFFIEMDSAMLFNVYAMTARNLLSKRIAMLGALLRRAGEIIGLGGDVFHLTMDELRKPPSDAAEIADTRRREREAHLQLDPPSVIFSDEVDLDLPPAPEKKKELEATGVSGGKARGRAVLLRELPRDASDSSGRGIVVKSLETVWGPILAGPSAAVVESAAPVGPAASLGKAFGVPVASCVADAFRQFEDNNKIEVNGITGKVLIERE